MTRNSIIKCAKLCVRMAMNDTTGWISRTFSIAPVPKLLMRRDRQLQVQRNLFLLVFFQLLMVLYVLYPYYISPYIHTIDYSTAQNYTLSLPNASYVKKKVPWLSAPYLPRVLSKEEHDACMNILALSNDLLSQYEVPYILAYGSLVGSYTMHDMLPWDDDIDILVSWKKYDRFKQLLGKGLKPHGLASQEYNLGRVITVKLFFQNGTKAGVHGWTWPFIDVAFYEENSTHIWNQNVQHAGDMIIPSEWFYPLTKRPFGSLWIPAPYNTAKFLQNRYGSLKCIQYGYNHKHEVPRWSIYYAPCRTLQKYYMFVWRTHLKQGVKETLKLGQQEIYSVVINYTFDEDASFSF